MFRKRVIVSFSGRCEMNCKHCFALEMEDVYKKNDIDGVVNEIAGMDFDIIYVSHNKENFYNSNEGIGLCEKLYDRYGKDLCITSRCVLTDNMIDRLEKLDRLMKGDGKRIFWCESIPALESASLTEDLNMVPEPLKRLHFIGELKKRGICTMMSVRPLFPCTIISNEEIHRLIKAALHNVDAIITGGLITTEEIDKRLNMNQETWDYLDNNESDYLVGAVKDNAKFVDVRKEIQHLKNCCDEFGIRFFEHSLQAVNSLAFVN